MSDIIEKFGLSYLTNPPPDRIFRDPQVEKVRELEATIEHYSTTVQWQQARYDQKVAEIARMQADYECFETIAVDLIKQQEAEIARLKENQDANPRG